VKKLAESIRRVGLIANPDKTDSARLVRRAARLLLKEGRQIQCDPSTASLINDEIPVSESVGQLARHSDLLLVFGGDGTILRVAREAAGLGVLILGVNTGHLGFLTGVPGSKLAEVIQKVIAGKFTCEERALLEATVQCGSSQMTQIALNDFVIGRGLTSRLIELEVKVNDELLTRYRCDGFVASSPTGSTAYSLAAGGAIVSPDAEVLILTPICPHTLSIRPVVVNLDATVQVKLMSSRLIATLAADGQQQTELSSGDSVTIRRSSRTARLLRPDGTSFFETLRHKFGWSGSNI
jgi:NAD+ kinase